MLTYNIYEAKAQLSKLLRRVERGEQICIARDGVVIARIVPELVSRGIQLGCDAGRGTIADDFDAPLDDFSDYEP